MIRHALFAASLLAATACSGQSRTRGAGSDPVVATAGESPNADQRVAPIPTLPDNAPVTGLKNVPATSGRANLPQTQPPFAVETIGDFDSPFAMAFLPDGALLVTDIGGAPQVARGGQGGLLDVAIAPDYAQSHRIYLTYAAPARGGSELAMMRATLDLSGTPVLKDPQMLWRSGSPGPGGQFGSIIAFAPDGKSLFLSSGERQRFTPAQDPTQALGKILHLTLDGKPWPGNPMYAAGGVRAMTWSSGHRNPYGLLFTPDGRLWEEEMGPKGGDELNLIQPGENYGWPVVSNGDNYSGQPIPDQPSDPKFAAPVLWWNPSVSPAGMIYYSGDLFPRYKGSLFIGTMSTPGLVRIALNGAQAVPEDYWDMGSRIRDVAQAPDGSIWLLEDGRKGAAGKLLRLTPKR